MKTTRQIINQTPKFDINNTKEKLDYHFNTKWYSEEEIKKAIDKHFICFERRDGQHSKICKKCNLIKELGL